MKACCATRPGKNRTGASKTGQQEFKRGYRAGREEERRRRASAGGAQQRNRSDMVVVPNYYTDNAPFQQHVLMPDYSRSMDRLLVAAQTLREAIQTMAQQPSGEERNRAIAGAREALLQTQRAMLEIPPALR